MGHFGQQEYFRAAKERKQCELDEYVDRPQCTDKRDTIYFYDTSDLMLIKIKYGRYNNCCVRTNESDTAITIVPVEIAVIAVEHAIIYSFAKKVCERGERARMHYKRIYYSELKPLRTTLTAIPLAESIDTQWIPRYAVLSVGLRMGITFLSSYLPVTTTPKCFFFFFFFQLS